MKVYLSFKTPDVAFEQLDDEERDAAGELIEKFVEHDENITVVFDTETGTCEGLKL